MSGIPDKPTEEQLEELCVVLYETGHPVFSPNWKIGCKISANLRSVTRDQALRVWKYFKEREDAWEFL